MLFELISNFLFMLAFILAGLIVGSVALNKATGGYAGTMTLPTLNTTFGTITLAPGSNAKSGALLYHTTAAAPAPYDGDILLHYTNGPIPLGYVLTPGVTTISSLFLNSPLSYPAVADPGKLVIHIAASALPVSSSGTLFYYSAI